MIDDLISLGSVSFSLLLDHAFPLRRCLTDIEALDVTLPRGPTVRLNSLEFGDLRKFLSANLNR